MYFNKDSSLSEELLDALLKYWPYSDTAKEVCFINELDMIFNHCEVQNLDHIAKKLFYRVSKCILKNRV